MERREPKSPWRTPQGRGCGELLEQIEPATGKNNQHTQVKGADAQPFHSRENAATSAGLSTHQAKQAIRVANVPAADFERQVESPTPPTVTALAEQGKKAAPRPVIDFRHLLRDQPAVRGIIVVDQDRTIGWPTVWEGTSSIMGRSVMRAVTRGLL